MNLKLKMKQIGPKIEPCGTPCYYISLYLPTCNPLKNSTRRDSELAAGQEPIALFFLLVHSRML